MKIILCGPPHSGKSCLREGLKQAVRNIVGAPYPYVITACPDGEGAWFQAASGNDAALARTLKDDYKGKFTPEFVQRVSESVQKCTQPLTLVDLGGRTTPENKRIASGATHAILLAGNSDDQKWSERLEEWRGFCSELGIEVIAEIFSDYHGDSDSVDSASEESGILRGSIHYLERGESFAERPCVKALAKHVVRMVKEEGDE